MEKSFECACCLTELTKDEICYYNHSDDTKTWIQSVLCWDTISELLSTKFHQYMHDLYHSKCKKTLGGMLEKGPPIWFKDTALPVPEGSHIVAFKLGNREIMAIYDGAVQGLEHEKLWNHVRTTIANRIAIMTPAEATGDQSDE